MNAKWIYSLLLLIVLCVIRINDPWIIEVLRLKALDSYQRSQEKELIEDIVIVEIDESSLQKYGQYPFPRDILAVQIQRIREAGASLIVLPILFSEPDRFGKDAQFIATINQGGVIISQSAATRGKGNPVPRGVAQIGTNFKNWLYNYPAAIGPIDSIGKAADGVGMILTAPEADGITRRLPLVIRIDGEVYPSLAMEILRIVGQQQSYQIKSGEGGIEAVRIPGLPIIKTDQNARVWTNFKYEAYKISLSDDAAFTSLKGKVVFLAPTAEGISNQVATPLGIKYGHDLVINTLSTLLSGTTIERPFWADISELAYAFAGSLILIILVLYAGWIYGIVAAILIFGGTYFGFYFAFTTNNLLLDWSFPVVCMFIVWSISAFVRFISEFKQKMQIKKQFGTYLSPAMVEKLQKNPELLQLGGETRELSIMFTDVRGFTTISEHYGKDVQGLTKIMNRYMTAMTSKIIENQGTLDKYIGDAQMAFWNAPLDDSDHRRSAIKTALAMMGSLDEFNTEIAKEGIPAFGMGLGINTDSVVVGNMGSIQRFDYTCLGDGVNLASRLEGQSKDYGVKIVLGENTIRGMDKEFLILELDTIAVKGKNIGVRIFTCLCDTKDTLMSNVSQIVIFQHKHMLEDYRACRFDSASRILKALIGSFGGRMDEYYKIMLCRCEQYINNPPPKDWDGVYRATTK
jgi:adenylate cyclase